LGSLNSSFYTNLISSENLKIIFNNVGFIE